MSIVFRTMYRFGFTPWDSGVSPPELKQLIEGPEARSPGKALDLGCGTGTNSIFLAQHGWQVTGKEWELVRAWAGENPRPDFPGRWYHLKRR